MCTPTVGAVLKRSFFLVGWVEFAKPNKKRFYLLEKLGFTFGSTQPTRGYILKLTPMDRVCETQQFKRLGCNKELGFTYFSEIPISNGS